MNKLLKIEKYLDDYVYEIRRILLTGLNKKSLNNIEKSILSIIKVLNRIISYKIDFNKIKKAINTSIINIVASLKSDSIFFYESDPAAVDVAEIILTYPGFYAIILYRLSHVFYELKIKYLPRMINEYAHSKTGIDIHPGAEIGDFFFIDHGTGIVIGETTIIGNHVKIYQNVTLGALSLENGQLLKGIKRHPTIGNNVTLYAGSSILGGNTIVEDNVIIGSNVCLKGSVSSNNVIK